MVDFPDSFAASCTKRCISCESRRSQGGGLNHWRHEFWARHDNSPSSVSLKKRNLPFQSCPFRVRSSKVDIGWVEELIRSEFVPYSKSKLTSKIRVAWKVGSNPSVFRWGLHRCVDVAVIRLARVISSEMTRNGCHVSMSPWYCCNGRYMVFLHVFKHVFTTGFLPSENISIPCLYEACWPAGTLRLFIVTVRTWELHYSLRPPRNPASVPGRWERHPIHSLIHEHQNHQKGPNKHELGTTKAIICSIYISNIKHAVFLVLISDSQLWFSVLWT